MQQRGYTIGVASVGLCLGGKEHLNRVYGTLCAGHGKSAFAIRGRVVSVGAVSDKKVNHGPVIVHAGNAQCCDAGVFYVVRICAVLQQYIHEVRALCYSGKQQGRVAFGVLHVDIKAFFDVIC